jgi:hypothetical protein
MLPPQAYASAADALKVHPAILQAITDVESRGDGFWPGTNMPKVLFERHIFSRRTAARFDTTHPHLSSRTPGGYATGKDAEARGRAEYERFLNACALDEQAAIEATSWGLGQILGQNYRLCGCATPQEFRQRMESSEQSQLDLLVAFLRQGFYLKLLQARPFDFEAFARRYNGPAFKRNQYDSKLKKSYDIFIRNWPK